MKKTTLFIIKTKNKLSKKEITKVIEDKLDLQDILIQSAKYWDGGYVICGLLGHGDSFALRTQT